MAASKKLSTYQAKRDFTKTEDPSGETSIVAIGAALSSRSMLRPACTTVCVSSWMVCSNPGRCRAAHRWIPNIGSEAVECRRELKLGVQLLQ